MKHRRLIIASAAALTLLLTLSACGGKQAPAPTPAGPPAPTDSTPPETAPLATSTPVPEESPAPAAPVWGEQTYSDLYSADDGALVMTVSYAFPKIENTDHPAAGAVNGWYAAQADEFLASAAETAAWGMGDYETAVTLGADFTPFVEELTFDLSRETADYVSVCRELYANNGGAHPNSYRFSEQFSLSDGHRLYFADFFSDPDAAIERILTAIEADPLAAEYGLGDEARRTFQAEQFYLTDAGFVFWYQTGELIPQGSPVEFAVPFEALSDLVALW